MRELAKAVFTTGVGSSASMILSAVSTKIMAIVSGPFGLGLYSLIQQLAQTVSASGLAGGGRTVMAQGIASRTVRERDDFILTAFWLLAIGVTLATSALLLFAPWIAHLVFNSDEGTIIGLVRWIGILVILTTSLVYLTGILNGFMAIRKLAVIQAAGAAVNALLSYPISILVDAGYLVAFVAMTTASLLVQVVICCSEVHRRGYLRPVIANGLRFRIETKAARSFFVVAGTMMVVTTVASVSLLSMRALVVQFGGISEAGIFTVAWTICAVYPSVILSSFATYYLPKLSQAKGPQEFNKLMNDVFRLTTILVVPLELVTVVLKPLVINILYSEEFISSLVMLRWMIIGVYFKATAQVFATPMLASADMKVHFWTNNLLYVGFVVFSFISVVEFEGLELIGVGYAVVFGAYLMYSLYYAESRHGYSFESKPLVAWLIGLTLIILASILTWNETEVDLATAGIFIAGGLVFMALSMTERERGRVRDLLTRAS